MNKPTFLSDGIIIPSTTDYLADVDRYIEEKMSQSNIDKSVMTDIAISISELVNNAIIHGNGRDESKNVKIHFSITKTEIKISVEDQGKGFDPEKLDNPIDDSNLLKEVGRGLFIVRSFVDDVKVSATASGGTLVAIIKKI